MKLQTKSGLIVLMLLFVSSVAVANTVSGAQAGQGAEAMPAKSGVSDEGAPKAGVIHGKVIDSTGEVVPGAAVIIKGTSTGVSTDFDGNYSISAAPGTVLVISSLGYKSSEVTVGRSAELNVTLEPETEMINDVIVVGYGTTKKTNLTGAVSVVKAEAIKDRSALDVAHMLQGAVPGLNVTSANGRPGEAAKLNIRGWNSINGGEPLVLIDGAEGNLQFVNPADVENISVIKDAAAAAIYGAKGSAGVILVTTKNGGKDKEGMPTIHYSGRGGFTAPTTSTEWETRGYYSVYLNNYFWKTYAGTQYATYTEKDMQELWIRRNDKVEDPSRPWVVIDQRSGRDTYNYYANTDWWHEMYNDIKPTTSHSISLSGSTKHVDYLISGGYTYEQGMFKVKPDKYNRYNLRAKLGIDVTKWLRIGNNLSYFNSSFSYPGQSGIKNNFSKSTVHALASYPVTNPDGTAVYLTNYNGYTIMDGLDMLLLGNNVNNDVVDNLSNTVDITITPFKGFTIKGDYTYTLYYKRYVNRATNGTYSKVPGVIETMSTGVFENKLTETSNTNIYNAANLYATYEHSWKEAHNFKIMAGVNYETKWLKDITAIGYNLYSDTLVDLDLTGSDDEGNKRTDVSGGQNEYRTAGYFARVNYDYKGRYLIEANARYDGSSRFLRNSRWVFSPSVSLGWRISEEPFFQPLKKYWDNLKIRFSWGQLGNQQLSEYYPAIRTVDTSGKSSYLLGGANPSVATIAKPVSSGLTWERSIQKNLGIDMTFLNGRLDFSAEGYIRDTKDMLTVGDVLPATYGYSSAPKENVADLRTMGYEFNLGWKDSFKLGGKPFHYNVSVLFSDYVSRITRFNNPKKLFEKNYWEGMTYGEIWGYHVDGLFATDEEARNYTVNQSNVNAIINSSAGEEKGLRAGDLKFADIDGNGKIDKGSERVGDSGDWQIIGNSQPRFNYGVNLGASWNGFDLSIFFQGIGHMDWYPGEDARFFWGPYARPYTTFIPKNFHTMYWTEENPDAYFPRPRGYVAMNGQRELGVKNDRYLQNIGYLRLKNLTFGYIIPQKATRKAKIEKLRIYFTGENLFYFAPGLHSKYIDPEMAMTNTNLSIYPWQKTFMFGIDITL
ncbi:MAG: TonB-dependent receptor [Bacteroidales bacterium]|nr:TonB-dependent receptor [Bacteroidales bacterium]